MNTGFKYSGYAGQYLRVNLSSGDIRKLPLPEAWAENFLGGNGMGVKILWDEVPPEVDPLGPENVLVVATGPLCGSPIPNSGRMEFVAKSPLTGIYGDSNAGGQFGPELKYAGYDLVLFEGKAKKPVYLFIHNDEVELCSARHLWGRGFFDTQRMLKELHKEPELKLAAIGQAGEHLVRYASIQVSPSRSAARSGMGAVMGSKNLKAIAVRGTNGIPIADPQRTLEICQEHHHTIRGNAFFPGTHRLGTPGLATLVNPVGRFPTQNHRYGSFDEIDKISGETLHIEHFVRDMGCFDCPVGCDKVYEVREGEFAGTRTTSVEYETVDSLGARILNSNLPAILKANQLCDDWGMDTISAGSAIAFAMELEEVGLMPEGLRGELDLSWGNCHTMLEVLRRIAFREGPLGDLLAEGSARAAGRLGHGAERYAMHVKGQDLPSQDGRAQQSMGLAHATSSRGADHLKAFPTIDETGYPSEAIRRYGDQYMPELVDPLAIRYKPMLVKDGEDYGAVVDSCGNCKSGGTFVMAAIYWEEQAEALRAITGMEIDSEQLMQTGERIYNLQRCYSALHGINRSDDTLPWRITRMPSPSGKATGSVCRLDEMLPEYYALRGWDPESGLPTRETLTRLGLDDAWQRVQDAVRSGKAQQAHEELGWAVPYNGPVVDPL